MTNEEIKTTHTKAKRFSIAGNILGCLTIVVYLLQPLLESLYVDSILENTAYIMALLTFISCLIANFILRKTVGIFASLTLILFIIFMILI
ncbi:hypothetical protein ACWEXP_13705 [Staphylococcus pseudoxylosus]